MINSDTLRPTLAGIQRAAVGLFFHLYSTFLVVSLAAPGISSWGALGIVGLIGVAMDVYRHMASPECKLDPGLVWDKANDKISVIRRMRISHKWVNTWAMSLVLYMVIAVTLTPPNDEFGFGEFISRWYSIGKLFLCVSDTMRDSYWLLMNSGHQQRARIVVGLIAPILPWFFLLLFILFSGYTYINCLGQLAKRAGLGQHALPVPRLLIVSVSCFAVGVVFSYLMLNFQHADLAKPNSGFVVNLMASNRYVYGLLLVGGGISIPILISYQCVTAARFLLWPQPNGTPDSASR